MRAVVVGAGAVGSRVIRLMSSERTWDSVEPADIRDGKPLPRSDVTVVAAPGCLHDCAVAALRSASHVVACADDPAEIQAALALDGPARSAGVAVLVGAAMAPGLSCLLASHLKASFDRVAEVHVASVGTGGPACARRHHAALSGVSVDWIEGQPISRPGGSGRELVWFPEPVGGADCYRASLADPMLLAPAFPDARRITARMEATRRDRLSSRLPMMRRPHPEGLVGAVRVEVRGWLDGRAETEVLGVARPPAVCAAAVAAVAATWVAQGRFTRFGAGGLAEMIPAPAAFLADVANLGVPVSAFAGLEI